MREILFRGKRVDNGEWVEGYFLPCNERQSLHPCIFVYLPETQSFECFDIDIDTLGEYTGLTGKNGTRIFEGDIIKSEQDGMIGVIRFGEYQTTNSGNGECHSGFSIEWYGKYSDLLRRDLGWWVKFGNTDINIFGNIHDNPELLEGE